MGAWGTDSFANDDAMDWIAEQEANGLAAVASAFAAVDAAADDYLDASIASSALAAAEVVAALLGGPSPTRPESDEFETWRAELADLKGRLG